jgi:hypothetical protein
MDLIEWTQKYPDAAAALAEMDHTPVSSGATGGEAAVVAKVRLEESRPGGRLWRNNVGAVLDPIHRRMTRYGLANDSGPLNARIKSADLIGIRPRVIVPPDVGTTIGQFLSVECKAPGWIYRGTDRERAQMRWAALVVSMGGIAEVRS